MAEFREVMMHMHRMCSTYDNCESCPLCGTPHSGMHGCDMSCDNEVDVCIVEAAVMDWAAKHPEPRYPTWSKYLYERGWEYCDEIPAHIAKKLVIEPISGGEQDG